MSLYASFWELYFVENLIKIELLGSDSDFSAAQTNKTQRILNVSEFRLILLNYIMYTTL